MFKSNEPLVSNPSIDLGEALSVLMGDTGGVQEVLGGFRIRVYHLGAFPWGEVMKQLTYRNFHVFVSRIKADIYIQANV